MLSMKEHTRLLQGDIDILKTRGRNELVVSEESSPNAGKEEADTFLLRS